MMCKKGQQTNCSADPFDVLFFDWLKAFQITTEICRKFTFKEQAFSCDRMNKTQRSRMEALTFQLSDDFLWAINGVTGYGMVQRCHVNTNLMCASGFQLQTNVSEPFVTAKHRPVSHRFSRIGVSGFQYCLSFSDPEV